MTASYWLKYFEELLSHITSTWDGMVVLIGDINFDLIGRPDSLVTRYSNTLDMFGLEKIVTKPTRVTRTCRTLIDHFITNYPIRISATDVFPISIVSDHDAPFASGRLTPPNKSLVIVCTQARNANDPFRQQRGVGELCKCVIFHSKFVQVQKVRLKPKLNYPSQFLHMF